MPLLGETTAASVAATWNSEMLNPYVVEGWREVSYVRLIDDLRAELKELKDTSGDAVLAAIKEAGFENKVLEKLSQITAKKLEELQAHFDAKLEEFQVLSKRVEELQRELVSRTAILEQIDILSAELGYQTKLAHKPF